MRNYGSKHHIGAGIAVAVVLLLAILLLSVQIQHVTVTGSDRYSAKQVEASVHRQMGEEFSPRLFFGQVPSPHPDSLCGGL